MCLVRLLIKLPCAQSSWPNHTNILQKRTNKNTKSRTYTPSPCWSLAACAQGQLWRGLIRLRALPLFFCGSALLIFWPCSALLAGCCELGPCQGSTVMLLTVTCTLCLTCSCCSLTVFSILAASFATSFFFWKFLLLFPQENRTAALTTSDHLPVKLSFIFSLQRMT